MFIHVIRCSTVQHDISQVVHYVIRGACAVMSDETLLLRGMRKDLQIKFTIAAVIAQIADVLTTGDKNNI